MIDKIDVELHNEKIHGDEGHIERKASSSEKTRMGEVMKNAKKLLAHVRQKV